MESEFYCVKCGHKGIPAARVPGKLRPVGHLKKLWCLYCKEETNHAECRSWTKYTYDDFKFEKDNNNFDDEGNRKLAYGLFKGEMLK